MNLMTSNRFSSQLFPQPNVKETVLFGSLNLLQQRQQVLDSAKNLAWLQKEAPAVRHFFEAQEGESIPFLEQVAIPGERVGIPDMRFRDVILAMDELTESKGNTRQPVIYFSTFADNFRLTLALAKSVLDKFMEKGLLRQASQSNTLYVDSKFYLIADILQHPNEDIWLTMKPM